METKSRIIQMRNSFQRDERQQLHHPSDKTKGNATVHILHFLIEKQSTTSHKSGTATSVLLFWCLVCASSTQYEFYLSILKLPSFSQLIKDVILEFPNFLHIKQEKKKTFNTSASWAILYLLWCVIGTSYRHLRSYLRTVHYSTTLCWTRISSLD